MIENQDDQTKPNASQVDTAGPEKPKKRSKKKQTNTQLPGILFILVMVIALGVGVYLSFQPARYGGEASEGDVVLSVDPVESSLAVGDTGTARVMINPNGEQVWHTYVFLNYDSSVIQVDEINPGNFFTDKLDEMGASSIDSIQIIKGKSSNSVRFIASLLNVFYEEDNPDDETPTREEAITTSSDPGVLFEIEYTVIGEGTSPLEFIVGDGVENNAKVLELDSDVNILGNVNNGTVTTGDDSGTTEARIYLSGPTSTSVGDQVSYDVMFDTNGQDVIGIDAKLNVPDAFEIVEVIQEGSAFSDFSQDLSSDPVAISANVGTNPEADRVNGNGLKMGTLVLNVASGVDTTQSLTFQFTQDDTDNANLNDTNMIKYIESPADPVDILTSAEGLTVSIQATAEPSPSPSPSASPDVTPSPSPSASPSPSPTPGTEEVPVTIRLLFQGKTRSSADKATPVSFIFETERDGSTETILREGTTNSDGEISITLPSGSYTALVQDVPGYLDRRFEDIGIVTPVAQGDNPNYINFPVPLLGGDINGNNGSGDDIVNSIDYAVFIDNFREDTSYVDLDASGEVNNLDFSIIRSNWEIQSHTLQSNWDLRIKHAHN